MTECADIARDVTAQLTPEWYAPFEMARQCRGIDGAEHLTPLAVASHVHAQSPEVREAFPGSEDFCAAFLNAWKKIKTLPGEDVLTAAARMADRFTLLIDKVEQEQATAGYKRFISFCGHLCVGLGTDRIKLPCREVGAALGVQPKTVSCYRQLALEQGYLVLLKRHNHVPNGRGEATLFRFRVELWEYTRSQVKTSA
ncbi:hypothetical protein [Frigoriglobus tundricola]|uniref:Uncharacterized protein n=1 Tax=Frigoriglobus tundricola TaxID=2774151 RepID=A0A6M5YGE3_9BACT|nr:hypothetical protein [Frigoriglobus tundricola]QJW93119.1 hypothetical protein FTUN_0622 [Frigoriglobus tundricola]